MPLLTNKRLQLAIILQNRPKMLLISLKKMGKMEKKLLARPFNPLSRSRASMEMHKMKRTQVNIITILASMRLSQLLEIWGSKILIQVNLLIHICMNMIFEYYICK